jgi:hypothetical protein
MAKVHRSKQAGAHAMDTKQPCHSPLTWFACPTNSLVPARSPPSRIPWYNPKP